MIIKLTPRNWDLVYYSNTNPVNKYIIRLTALSDGDGKYPVFPVSVTERGKPGSEVYAAIYADMTKQMFLSLQDLAFAHNSAINDFESIEDLN